MHDFILFDLKRDPPVPTDGNAPRPGPVPGKLVHAPAGRALHTVHVLRHDQHGQNLLIGKLPHYYREANSAAAHVASADDNGGTGGLR